MSEENKHRQFWIRPRRINKGPTWNCTTNLMKYAEYTDIIHVVEYSALKEAEEKLKVAESALKRIADMNYDNDLGWGGTARQALSKISGE